MDENVKIISFDKEESHIEAIVEKNGVPVEPVPKTYTMKVGDTLTKLARRFYGSPSYVVEIINANNFPDPNNVPVGAVVIMPEITQH